MPPRAPYVAVIFSSQRQSGSDPATDGYAEMAAAMEALASRQPGYLGIESARDPDGFGMTVSYWTSEADAVAWRHVAEHAEARRLGRDRWYASYHVRIAVVEREYTWARPTMVVHLALPSDWAAARSTGAYTTSTRGVTLADEGFIHCSYDHQVAGVATRFYADLHELIVLRIDTTRLRSPVIVEPPFPGSPEAFPHVYGPIELDAVESATAWSRAGECWEWSRAGGDSIE